MTKYLSLMLPNVPAIVVAAVDESELLLGEIGATLLCMARPDVVVVLEDHPAVLPISSSNTLFVLRLVMISGVREEFMVHQWRGKQRHSSVLLSCSPT